jgi:glycosyltransferase involved in cell wall biosynthesis
VALDFAQAVVVNSMASCDYYLKTYGLKTTFIPNATAIPEVRETGVLREFGLSHRGYILFVGRLVPEKGCHHLVAAHEALGLTVPVLVVGEPAHSNEYADRLRSRAGPFFIFAGGVFGDRLTELYARSLLVVNPTERDAVSLVLLEAMAQGACVLTSDIQEMVEGVGGCGYHFRSGDSVDLARVLSQLLANPAAIDAPRESARERVRRIYGWEPVVDQFEAVYKSLVKEGSS